MDTKLFQDYGRRVIENCGKVIVGKDEEYLNRVLSEVPAPVEAV